MLAGTGARAVPGGAGHHYRCGGDQRLPESCLGLSTADRSRHGKCSERLRHNVPVRGVTHSWGREALVPGCPPSHPACGVSFSCCNSSCFLIKDHCFYLA